MRFFTFVWVLALLVGLTAVSSILAAIFGEHTILLAIGSSIFTPILALWATDSKDRYQRKVRSEVEKRQRHEQLERQQSEQLERRKVSTLDQDCGALLQKAKIAEKEIIASDACNRNLINPPVDKQLLKDNVQAVFGQCREITDLRAEHRSIVQNSSRNCTECGGAGTVTRQTNSFIGFTATSTTCRACKGTGLSSVNATAGPMTDAVIKPQQKALEMALESVRSRVVNLEYYASTVKAVDVAYKDWIGAQKAEQLNARFRELVIKTVEDELAVKELTRLTQATGAAEQAFRHSVQEANLAAETLALPNEK